MNNRSLNEAITESERFLLRAKVLREFSVAAKFNFEASSEQAAVRRASMDLTKSLAALRKGD